MGWKRVLRQIMLLSVFCLMVGGIFFVPGQVVSASSEDNIDTFDVHPANRWTINEGGFTSSVSNSMLNLSDTGDGTSDSYRMDRSLRDLSGTIEYRFKYDVNDSFNSGYDYFSLYLMDVWGTHNYISFANDRPDDGGYTRTFHSYYDQNDAWSGYHYDDDYLDNTWYNVRIDYDVLLSKYRCRVYFDNGTKYLDKDESGIFSSHDERPLFFKNTELVLVLIHVCYTDGLYSEVLIDYVDAPFTEREWKTEDESNDPQWVEKNWNLARADGEVTTDTCNYSLTVPRLDAVSGTLTFHSDDDDNFASIHGAALYFGLYGVDADDGERHLIVGFANQVYDDGSGDACEGLLLTGSGYSSTEYSYSVAYTGAEQPRLDFSIGTFEDRSEISAKARWYPDSSAPETFYDMVWSDSISYSQEFVIETYYWINIDAGEDVLLTVGDFDLVARDIFKDVGNFIGDVVDGVGDFIGGVADVGSDLFGMVFQWLANTLTGAFQLIIDGLQAALETALSAIEGAVGLVETAIGTMQTALESAIGLVETAVDAATTAIDGLVDDIQAIGEDVIDYMVTIASDVVDAILGAIETLYGAVEDVAFAIWNGATGNSDILGAINTIWSNFWTTVGKIPQGFTDVMSYVDFYSQWLVIFMTVFYLIYSGLGTKTTGEYAKGLVDTFCMNVNPAKGQTMLGFIPIGIYIPYGLVWLPLFLFELGWSA